MMEPREFEKDGQRFRIEDPDDEEYVCDNDLWPINGETCNDPALYEVTALGGPENGNGPFLCLFHALQFTGMNDLT